MADFGSALWNKPASVGGGGSEEGSGAPSDPVTRSLRFKDADNSHLYFDPTATHDSTTVYTFSCWAKLGEMSAESYEIFTAGYYTSGSSQDLIYFGHNADSKMRVWLRSTHDSTNTTYTSTAVFRDPAAWYHLTLVRNGASLKVYVNNTEVISETISSTQRYGVGNGYAMHVGSSVKPTSSSVSSYASFDGLLADIYFTDGHAKSPTDFIELGDYGNYIPKAYTGEFGTNGFHLDAQPANDSDLMVSSVGRNDGDTTFVDVAKGHTITKGGDPEHSDTVGNPFGSGTAMYFDGSGDYLNIGTTSDFRTTTNNFTLDFWFKPNGSSTGTVFSNVNDGNVYDGLTVNVSSVSVIVSLRDSSSSNNVVSLSYTNDDTDWHHVEVSRTGSTLYLFVDGNLEDSGSISFTPTNSGLVARAGRTYASSYSGTNNYAGYLFDYRWSNSGGHTASFTAPTAPLELNPVYIGGDQSGNKNHFTVSGISITHDVLLDCPTKNYCLINPLAETKTDSSSYDSNPTTGLSEGNLKLTSSALFFNGHGTLGVSSGKWYFEWYSTGDWVQGGFTTHEMFSNKDQSLTDFWVLYNRDSTSNIAVQYKDGTGSANAGWAGGGHASGNGNVFGCAFDVDNRKMYFHKNGEWSDGTSTLTSTFPSSYAGDLTGSSHNIPADTTFYPTVRPWTSSTVIANFGQDSTFANTVSSGSANAADANGNGDFRYTPPSGYLALCTANLDAPSVTPSEHFNTVLYTGDGNTNHDITGVGFESALTWIKSRSSRWHQWYDAARGAGKVVHSNSSNSESDNTAYFGPFQSDGFRLAPTTSGTGENASGENYVAWNWKADQTPTSARTTYTVKVEDASGDGWDANTSWIDGSNFPTLYMELFENQTSGLVSLGKVAVRSVDDDGNSTPDQSEQTYTLKCVDLDAIAVKWYYDTSGDGQESDYPNSYNDFLNDQKITILEGTSSTSGTWLGVTGQSGTNNHSNDDGATDYNYSPPTGWANGDTLKSATTSYTGSDTATLTSGAGPVEKYNAAAGFSIISYTGNKSADGNADGETQEITHSLGAEPELIITKSRGSGSYDSGYWEVYHKHTVMDSSHSDNSIHPQLWLNNNWDAYQGSYNPAIPKSGSANTIIEVTNDNSYGHYANESGLEYIMYAWAPVDGYSKFGSYVGNGSSDGPMVYTGFRPALVIMKKTTASGAWHLFDNKRSGYNHANDVLQPNASDAELSGETYEFVDLLSNGFKVRRTTHGPNSNGETYIWAAWAEQPFSAPSNAR